MHRTEDRSRLGARGKTHRWGRRFGHLHRLAYGYDAKLFDRVTSEYLPKSRARNCRYEYVVLRYAYKQLIVPHLDMDLAKDVMDAKWLDDTDRRPQALRGDESRRRR